MSLGLYMLRSLQKWKPTTGLVVASGGGSRPRRSGSPHALCWRNYCQTATMPMPRWKPHASRWGGSLEPHSTSHDWMLGHGACARVHPCSTEKSKRSSSIWRSLTHARHLLRSLVSSSSTTPKHKQAGARSSNQFARMRDACTSRGVPEHRDLGPSLVV